MSILQKNGWLAALLAATLLMSACSQGQVEKAQPAAAPAETVKIVHKQGETIIKKHPQKIVVFDLNALDTLEKLGIPVTALPKGALPSYLTKYKGNQYVNAGGLMEPDFEKINSLKPDLIIISNRQAKFYPELSAIAPTISLQLAQKDYMASFKANMRQLAVLFDKQEQVEQELSNIDAQITAIRQKVASSNLRALVVMTTGGKVTAFGPGSRFALIHDVLGLKPVMEEPAVNAKNETHGKVISYEYIAQNNPDYLFVIDRDDAIGQSGSAQQLLNNALINRTNAAKSGRIVYLNSGLWYLAGGGLMSVAAMVDEVGQAVH